MTEKELAALLASLDPRGAPQVAFARKAPSGITQPGQRLGVFSASFNPLTNAHVRMVELAAEKALVLSLTKGRLDEIVLLLAKANVDKQVFGASLEERLMMMLRFADKRPNVSVAACSHGRFVDKAAALKPLYPPDTQVFFIVGYDTLVRLFDPKYYADMPAELQTLFSIAEFIAFNRGEHSQEAIEAVLRNPEAQPFSKKVHPLVLDDFHAQLSSTKVRQRLSRGESIEGLVPQEVAAFIKERGLYTR